MPDETEQKSHNADTLTIIGGAIKAIGDNLYEGCMVKFTNPSRRDLTGEYFDTATDFVESDYPFVGKALYHHGLDRDLEIHPIGEVVYAEKRHDGIYGQVKIDFADRYKTYLKTLSQPSAWKAEQEAAADEYEEMLKGLIESGKLSWSTGALPQGVVTDEDGHIRRWPIIERSLTPSPAEPEFTRVTPLKSLPTHSLRGLIAREVKADDSASVLQSNSSIEGESNMDLEQIKQVIQDVLKPLLDMFMGNAAEEVAEDDADALMKDAEAEAMNEVPENEDEYKSLTRAQLEKIAFAAAKKSIARYVENRERRAESMKAVVESAINDGRKAALSGREGKSKVKAYSQDSSGKAGFNINHGVEKPTWLDTIRSFVPGLDTPESRRRAGVAGRNSEAIDAVKAQNPYIGPLGGFTVEQVLRDEILDPLRPEVISFDLGVRQTPAAGAGVVVLPKMTTAPSAFRPGINQAVTGSNAKFDTVTAFLRPIAAEVVVPIQWLDSSLPQAETKIKEQMVKSIALQIDKEVFVGTGAVEDSNTGASIRGVLQVAPSANQVTLATNGRRPTYQDLQDAQTQIATQNVLDDPTMGWAFHPRTRGTFYGMVDNVGQPLWRQDMSSGARKTFLEYNYGMSTQIPINVTTGTNAATSYIFYGRWDYAEYIMSQDIAVFVNPYIYANQLQVQLLAYTFSDLIFHYPEAFYVMSGVAA